ncbi:MAG: glycosyltransferase family 4 protein [Saprospiraceae bacterium]
MKILQICKKVPWPLTDGESLAIYGMAKGLYEEGHDLHLMAMNTSKHHRNEVDAKNRLLHYSSHLFVNVDNGLTHKKLIKNLFQSKPIHVTRLENDRFQIELKHFLTSESFDIILFETVYPSIYLATVKVFSDAKIVIRCHNAEHVIWDRISDTSPLWNKWYYRLQAKRIKTFEKENLNSVDYFIPLTDNDQKIFEKINVTTPSEVIPIGLEIEKYNMLRRRDQCNNILKICFIGSLDWLPNLEGIKWFLVQVWPYLISKHGSKVQLHIAGKNMPKEIIKLKLESVSIHGEVEDAIGFISDNDIMIVPLFAGSGQRVKVLEAMALGKTVISTSVGIEGISAVDGYHFYKADTSVKFITTIEACMNQDHLLDAKTVNSIIKEKYNYKILSKKVAYVLDIRKKNK